MKKREQPRTSEQYDKRDSTYVYNKDYDKRDSTYVYEQADEKKPGESSNYYDEGVKQYYDQRNSSQDSDNYQEYQ